MKGLLLKDWYQTLKYCRTYLIIVLVFMALGVFSQEDLGFTVAVSLSAGEEGGVSAGDLAAAETAVKQDPTVLVLYDDQYTVRYPSVDGLVPAAQVLALDTGVKGAGSADDWLRSMERTAQALERCGEGLS